MKAIPTKVEFLKEYESKYGLMFLFKVFYGDKWGLYSSKSKDQDKFVEGKEIEFTEETHTGKNGDYLVFKPLKQIQNSGFGRQLKKEQSRYSGFALSYAKDLVVGGRIPFDQLYTEAKAMFEFMVALDKTLEV